MIAQISETVRATDMKFIDSKSKYCWRMKFILEIDHAFNN